MKNILVIGLGKVGRLVAELLNQDFSVTGLDKFTEGDWPFSVIKHNISTDNKYHDILNDFDAVISCLPYSMNLPIASAARELNIHYFDLTEDVSITKAIRSMATGSSSIMAPQCGLAPGFIGIVGAGLTHDFKKIRSIELRVGALPLHPSGLLGYSFNWSPAGLVNEYLNDCKVIRDGKVVHTPSLEGLETIHITGQTLEAFSTSGGLGTMCETFDGKTQTLNYKSIRYPGHCRQMRFLFNELLLRNHKKLAEEILVTAKPPVQEDRVFVYATVEGWKSAGTLERAEFVRDYRAIEILGKKRNAIAWTTAASVCAIVEMVENGDLTGSGFLKQESIDLDKFMATKNGQYYSV